MSEKHKRMDLDEVRKWIDMERQVREQERIDNGERIARKIIDRVANGKVSIFDGKMRVNFSVWRRDAWIYDQETVQAILRANGLRLENSDGFDPYGGHSSIKWGRMLTGAWFEVTVGLFEFADSDKDGTP